ncbi:MAG: hypothetical protein L3J89_03905 [Gammaproteobacteria bacterium]|nr:hypothetical protein [Gammaproteobacteria bacterium]
MRLPNKLYEMSLLSEASYADIESARNADGTFDAGLVEDALMDSNFNDMKFSQTQATEFISQWRVIEHQERTTSGFSSTLFENITTGEKTLSIRGTELGDVADWYTNVVDIGVLGSTSSQEQYQDLKDFYQQLITDGALGASETFSVAGHSLGGFMAQAFAIDFSSQVSRAYTYNAPGFDNDVLGELGVSQGNIATSNITNLIAEAGPEFVAGLGTMLGDVQNIFIEDQGPLRILDNHSITLMSDSLAAYNLFASLDTNLNANGISAITNFIENSSYIANNSLETTIDMLSGVFGVTGNVTIDDRDSLYTQIQAIEASGLFTNSAGAVSIVDVNSLVNAAMDNSAAGYAYRYALVNLNPFAITGNAGLYLSSEWSADNFTEQYLQDRAYMLSQLSSRNAQDSVIVPETGGLREYYDDRASGIEALTFATPGSDVPDDVVRYTFGDDNLDTINGGNQGDYLYGGAGNDTITGNAGADYIEGNDGADILNGGEGVDTLLDGAGDGSIIYSDPILTGGLLIDDGQNDFSYRNQGSSLACLLLENQKSKSLPTPAEYCLKVA